MSTSTHPHNSWGKRLLAILLWALFAAIFGLVGWFVMLKPAAVAVGNWSLARDYQPVQATPVKQTGQDADGSFTWYSVRYEAGGKSLETNRLSVLEDEAIDEAYNATVFKRLEQASAAGQTVEIYMSPRMPEVAVISRELPLSSLWSKALVGFGFGIFALAGLAGVFGAITGIGYQGLLEAAPLWIFSGLWCGFIFPIFLLVTSGSDVETFAVIMVGLFAVVGIFIMWGAIAVSFGYKSAASEHMRPGSKLTASALATTYGKDKGKAVKGTVKRGGLGGRTGDFDRN